MIERVSANDVIAGCRRTLGIPEQGNGPIDTVLFASLLRRSAGMHCPCSRATLRASVLECTSALAADDAARAKCIDDMIEWITVGGDLLELDDVVTEDTDVRQTWVFAAPPGFVIRPDDGTAFLFGVVKDQDALLPRFLSTRVSHDRFRRCIEPRPDENLADALEEQGLQQCSVDAWLKCPRTETWAKMLSRVERYLERRVSSANIENLMILDTARPVSYYPDRWGSPKNQSGIFVARRPREFGTDLWCIVGLDGGKPTALLDLPFEKTRWRACDTAWHIQMAIDNRSGLPQQYRRCVESGSVRFDFFSPLPLWAQRRLMIFGNPTASRGSFLSFLVPCSRAAAEESFLRNNLWLSPVENPNQE